MVEVINNSEDQWGGCSKDLRDGVIGPKVVKAIATWKGQGSWTPAIFCFTTMAQINDNIFPQVTTCTPDASLLPLRNGDDVTLTCKHEAEVL